MNYDDMPNEKIICIDMRSFYCSATAMLEGLDVMKVPMAVVSNLQQPGGVVLAASPPLKEKFRVKTGTRRWEISKHPDIRLFEPKMSFFIELSMAITRLISQYVPDDDIHIYSIDESWVNLSNIEMLWGPAEETAKEIQKAIYDQFRIPSSIGMGPNMLLAKLALDLEGKKTGFAKWTYEDVPKKLWPVRPLSEMWGIGSRMEANLNDMGIFTVYDLAHSDLRELEKKFGIMGNQLYYHAWGIDNSNFGEPLVKGQISFGKGQMLMRDYHTRNEIAVVLLEICEDVMRRTREAGFVGRTITLGLSYSNRAVTKSFQRSKTIEVPTNETLIMHKVCLELLDKYFEGEPARQLSVRLTNLEPENCIQLDLFDENKEKRLLIGHTMDAIRRKHGATSLLRAASFTKAGTALKREKLIGGHLA